jgi:hypothetical protein
MIELKTPWHNGFQYSSSTWDDLTGLSPLDIARIIFGKQPSRYEGEYVLVDNRSRFGYPLTKKGVPSKIKKWIANETEIGRFTLTELENK